MADIYDMSDDELEAAFQAAKAEQDSPETEIENEDVADEEEVQEEVDGNEDEEVEDEIGDDLEDDDDLEQPEEDSDSDDDVDDTDEEEEDEDSESDEDKPDEEDPEEEEQTEESDDTKVEDTQPVQKLKFKANGLDYEFSQEEILEQFPNVFGQAMDYTKKTQALKPWRKTIDALEQAKLNHDDINVMIDVLKGDKDAIAEVLKRTGVDALELGDDEERKYTPNDYGRDETTIALSEVVDKISADNEYGTTQRILSKDWDEASFNEMTKEPRLVEALHVDVKTGVYQKVQPIADMLRLRDGGRKSDLEYYKDAGRQYYSQQKVDVDAQKAAEQRAVEDDARKAEETRLRDVKAKEAQRKTVKTDAKKRKAAAPTAKRSGAKKQTDFLDESDEAFESWYQNLQDSQ